MTILTCVKCGFLTDNSAAYREHILKQLRGYPSCASDIRVYGAKKQ